MQWITIDLLHLNTNRIEGFHWMEGKLCIRFAGSDALIIRKDPDKKKYHKLCDQLGVRPVEEDSDGQE